MTKAEQRELEQLRAFKLKVEPVLQSIYDVFYYDSDQGYFDPDKEWDSACDFLEMVADSFSALYPPPKRGTTNYPELKK